MSPIASAKRSMAPCSMTVFIGLLLAPIACLIMDSVRNELGVDNLRAPCNTGQSLHLPYERVKNSGSLEYLV